LTCGGTAVAQARLPFALESVGGSSRALLLLCALFEEGHSLLNDCAHGNGVLSVDPNARPSILRNLLRQRLQSRMDSRREFQRHSRVGTFAGHVYPEAYHGTLPGATGSFPSGARAPSSRSTWVTSTRRRVATTRCMTSGDGFSIRSVSFTGGRP